MNYFKTFLLMTGLTLLFMFIGNYFGGAQGMTYALIFAVGMNFISYWFSDKIVLAMYGAKPINRSQAPGIYKSLERLSNNAGIPVPKLYLVNNPMPNAFATGRNPENGVVAITTGIMDILDERELEAVLAHELSHIKNRDILIQTVAASIAGAITLLARFAFFFGGSRDNNSNPIALIAMLILAPLAAILVQMAISRSREYGADNGAAKLTGRPQDLVSALEKLHASVKRSRVQPQAEPATAHMFIVNPFKGDFIATMFSTHPSLAQRKANLLGQR